MTKTLYLMCPGQTLFNAQGKLEGWCDTPMTELGRRQVRATAHGYLAGQDARPDHFFCSTAERASDTLELACEVAYGVVPPYERRRGLKGYNYGVYGGKDACLAPEPPFGSFFVAFGGDSDDMVARRMRDCLLELMGRPDVHVALVVGHAPACVGFHRAWAHAEAVCVPSRLEGGSMFRYAYDEDAREFCCLDFFEPQVLSNVF